MPLDALCLSGVIHELNTTLSAPSEDVLLRASKEEADAFKPLCLGGSGHILYGGPVEVFCLGFAMEHQPGADHHFINPVCSALLPASEFSRLV